MRAAIALVSAVSALAVYSEFSPYLELYPSNQCNDTKIVIDGATACTPAILNGQTVYVANTGCNFDDNVFGLSFCSDSSCQTCAGVGSNAVFDQCTPTVASGATFSYKASCSAKPCCQTSAIVICFAVFLSVGAGGLCIFWGYTDRLHKAKAAAEQRALEASVEEETRKAKAVGGGIFGAGASTSPSGGYSAL